MLVASSLVEWFSGEPEADLQSKADVVGAVEDARRLARVDTVRLRVNFCDDLHNRSRSQNHHRVASKRANHHIRVPVVVDVRRARRQRRAKSPQSGDARKFPGVDALRVGGENPARRPAKYVHGAVAFVRRANRQIYSRQQDSAVDEIVRRTTPTNLLT